MGLWRLVQRFRRWLFWLLWELDLRLTRLWYRRQVEIQGSCNACGKCCQGLVLWQGSSVVKDRATFAKLVKAVPETYARFEPGESTRVEESGGAGHLVFRCTKLGEDGRCTDYAERPIICRRFPEPRLFIRGYKMPPRCGFQGVVKRQ